MCGSRAGPGSTFTSDRSSNVRITALVTASRSPLPTHFSSFFSVPGTRSSPVVVAVVVAVVVHTRGPCARPRTRDRTRGRGHTSTHCATTIAAWVEVRANRTCLPFGARHFERDAQQHTRHTSVAASDSNSLSSDVFIVVAFIF